MGPLESAPLRSIQFDSAVGIDPIAFNRINPNPKPKPNRVGQSPQLSLPAAQQVDARADLIIGFE